MRGKKWRGDLTCESGDAYLHANFVTRRGGREESAPQAPDRESAREERHSEHKRETSDPTNGQTKESKGSVDETAN